MSIKETGQFKGLEGDALKCFFPPKISKTGTIEVMVLQVGLLFIY